MHLRLLYTLFVAGLAAILWTGSSGGPGAVQGEDRTGSPLSGGLTCQLCHNGGQFSPTIQAQVLDDTLPVTAYQPGKTYTFRVVVTPTTGTPAAYGYQAVALIGEDNANGGAFGEAPQGQHVVTLSNRQYAEHSMPNDTNVFVIPWTAPEQGSGPVRFYASGNAVNLNNSSGGDGAVRLNPPLTLQEDPVSSVFAPAFAETSIFPNPAADFIRFKSDQGSAGINNIRITDLNGKNWLEQRSLTGSSHSIPEVDIRHLPDGIYLVEFAVGNRSITRKLVKI